MGDMMKAKEYVEQIKRIDKLIMNMSEELYLMKSKALHSSLSFSGDIKVKTSKPDDLLGDMVSGYMDEEKRINEKISQCIKRKREIIATIEMLPLTEYDFLYKMYVLNYTLNDLANLYDRSYSWATAMHAKALNKLQKIID